VRKATPPNVLWICTDQQRWDTIGALGNPHVHTPHLDRLVREGVAFTHAFCQSTVCTPSRASFLTGRYPSSVRASTNGNDSWAGAAPLVTRLLADAGYDCGLSGKLHLSAAQGRVERRAEAWDGYRVFEWSHGPVDLWPEGHAYAGWLREQGHSLAALRQRPEEIPPELHQTTWCTDVAIRFIEEHAAGARTGGVRTGDAGRGAGGPWLFSVNVFDPHPPFDPPRPYLERFDRRTLPGPLFRESDLAEQARLAAAGVDFQTAARRPEEFDGQGIQAAYYAMIELIDHNVGRLLDALDRTGQRERTVVLFMSDHGEALGDHGLLAKGCRFYEGLVRVPLIWSWPGAFPAGLRSDALVELVDVAPTLLELTALPGGGPMHGRSLGPILTADSPPHQHREQVRCEYYRALNPADFPGFTGSFATMVRDREHKLVAHHSSGTGELYDLKRDPGEHDNLWNVRGSAPRRAGLERAGFDSLAMSLDLGSPQIARF
jgi:arylsulfatase A-like enzyme